MVKQRISTYSMKMRIYPSNEQKLTIDRILRALHLAYNMTFHQVFLMNPAVCTAPKENGAVWPDYNKMANKKWRQYLISQNAAVADAPAASLMNNNGLFHLDGKRAWQTGMHNIPVSPDRRRDFRFYSSTKPRSSFFVQIRPEKLVPSAENDKVAWIDIPKVGKMKARGFNRRLFFGNNGQYTYPEALAAGELPTQVSVRVSKDSCGDYFVSVTFSEGKKKDRSLFLEMPVAAQREPVGIDVGIKDIAILSTGQKVENKHFKREKQGTLVRLNRALSRRWGPANMAYRDYNRDIRQENRGLPPEEARPLAQPSRKYRKTQQKKAAVERKIARRRNTYYHQQTAAVVRQSSMIAMETLHVSNMLRNHKLAYALADAAMSDFLAKLSYKAERCGIEVHCVGAFMPTSQLCSACGTQHPEVKNLSIRRWTCPSCGATHDRDINAAKNILRIALTHGGAADKPPNPREPGATPIPKAGRRRWNAVFPDNPDIVVVYSKELTGHNDPRYVICHARTGKVLDDAQGAGYRSASNARNCYKAKIKWAQKAPDPAFNPA